MGRFFDKIGASVMQRETCWYLILMVAVGVAYQEELQMLRLEYFLMMFLHNHLQEMARLRNKGLTASNMVTTTVGELLKFFGLLILACIKV